MSLKVGDVVELKSGGPQMSVSNIGSGEASEAAKCNWFNEKKELKSSWFKKEILKLTSYEDE
jgi:uncharacterized protein YodC (DUF2158 family)